MFDAEVHATLLYNSFTPSAKKGQSQKPINFPLAAAMFFPETAHSKRERSNYRLIENHLHTAGIHTQDEEVYGMNKEGTSRRR